MKALDNPNNKRAAAFLRILVKEEKSLSEMARILNKEGFVTSQGKENVTDYELLLQIPLLCYSGW